MGDGTEWLDELDEFISFVEEQEDGDGCVGCTVILDEGVHYCDRCAIGYMNLEQHARELIDAAQYKRTLASFGGMHEKWMSNLRAERDEARAENDKLRQELGITRCHKTGEDIQIAIKCGECTKLRELLRRVGPTFQYATCDDCGGWPGETDGTCNNCTARITLICELAAVLGE